MSDVNKVRIEIDADIWRWVKVQAAQTGRTTSQVVEGLLYAAQVKATRQGVPMDKLTTLTDNT